LRNEADAAKDQQDATYIDLQRLSTAASFNPFGSLAWHTPQAPLAGMTAEAGEPRSATGNTKNEAYVD
jgi:hypothetical protein